MKTTYDVFGNILIAKFPHDTKKSEKIKVAKELLKERKSVNTVLEKSEKFKGRLRKMKTSYLVGEKTKIAEYIENSCKFRFDVDETYFSPRLSNERKEISEQVKKNEEVFVMFAGVGPFAIVIARNSKNKLVVSNEINRKASKFAEGNVKLNKLQNVEVVQGDSRRVALRYSEKRKKFDRVVMPRPQLNDSFLDAAFKIVKKNGIINYYGFANSKEEVLSVINEEAKKARKKIKILRAKKAGDIGVKRWRWRVDFKVL